MRSYNVDHFSQKSRTSTAQYEQTDENKQIKTPSTSTSQQFQFISPFKNNLESQYTANLSARESMTFQNSSKPNYKYPVSQSQLSGYENFSPYSRQNFMGNTPTQSSNSKITGNEFSEEIVNRRKQIERQAESLAILRAKIREKSVEQVQIKVDRDIKISREKTLEEYKRKCEILQENCQDLGQQIDKLKKELKNSESRCQFLYENLEKKDAQLKELLNVQKRILEAGFTEQRMILEDEYEQKLILKEEQFNNHIQEINEQSQELKTQLIQRQKIIDEQAQLLMYFKSQMQTEHIKLDIKDTYLKYLNPTHSCEHKSTTFGKIDPSNKKNIYQNKYSHKNYESSGESVQENNDKINICEQNSSKHTSRQSEQQNNDALQVENYLTFSEIQNANSNRMNKQMNSYNEKNHQIDSTTSNRLLQQSQSNPQKQQLLSYSEQQSFQNESNYSQQQQQDEQEALEGEEQNDNEDDLIPSLEDSEDNYNSYGNNQNIKSQNSNQIFKEQSQSTQPKQHRYYVVNQIYEGEEEDQNRSNQYQVESESNKDKSKQTRRVEKEEAEENDFNEQQYTDEEDEGRQIENNEQEQQ